MTVPHVTEGETYLFQQREHDYVLIRVVPRKTPSSLTGTEEFFSYIKNAYNVL